MDFTQDFNFGVQETTILEGESALFSSSPEEVKPKEEETHTDNFQLKENEESPLFNTPPVEEVTEAAVEEQPKIEEETEEENIYTVSYKTLLDEGIFLKEEEEKEITTPQELLQRFDYEADKRASMKINQYLGRFGQDKIDFFNAVFENGVDPKEYFRLDQNIQSVKSIDLESLENQELVISLYYKELGWSDTKIKKQLKRLEDDGETEEEAKEAHSTLLQREESMMEQLLENQRISIQQKQQEYNYYTNQMNSIISSKLKEKDFDGIPVTDKVANTTFDFLTTQKWQLPSGELLSDFDKWILDLKKPENYETKVKIALLAQNGFDFSKIKTKAISEKSDKLFQGLTKKQKTQERNNSPNQGFTF